MGGVSSPIPADEALKDECDKLIVVLTRDRNFIKPPLKMQGFCLLIMRKYPAMIELLKRHHEVYLENQEKNKRTRKRGKSLCNSPYKLLLLIDRFERKKEKLLKEYHHGFNDGEEFLDKII